MKENNVYYMQKAYKLALIAGLNNSIPVGCVCTDKNDIESVAYNIKNRNSDGKHAEMLCVDKLSYNKKISKISLFTTLIPCPMCSGYIYMKNIQEIYIGTYSNNELYNAVFDLLLNKKYKSAYLQNKCSHILSSFFAKMR